MELPVNQYLVGDCLDIMKEWPDNCVDLIVTDPPYGINANKTTLGSGKHEFERGGDWDNVKIDKVYFSEMLRVSRDVAIWGGNYYTDILPPNNKWLIWHKLNDGLSFSEAELAWTNYSMNTRVYSKYTASRVKQHPTEKPIEIIRWCLSLSKFEGIVCDPFACSGTTALACDELNRNWICIDIEQKYRDIAMKRLQGATIGLF